MKKRHRLNGWRHVKRGMVENTSASPPMLAKFDTANHPGKWSLFKRVGSTWWIIAGYNSFSELAWQVETGAWELPF